MGSLLDGRTTPNRKYLRDVATKLTFPTIPSLQAKPRSIRLIQKQREHDILTITFSSTSALWFDTIKTGVPIQFRWTQNNRAELWYGYVSHVSKSVEPQRVRTMEVVCVGASFPLKERATRVFTDVTIPEAVQTIGQEFGFNVIVDADTRRFPQLMMAGHSYWEWIQEQAKRIGFAATVSGTNLYFRNMSQLIDQHASTIPVLNTGDSFTPTGADFYERTLHSFKVLKGDHLEADEQSRTNKLVGGVDPLTGYANVSEASPNSVDSNLRESNSAVLFQEYRSDQVGASETHLLNSASGAAQLARFNMPARIVAHGDSRIKPFYPVYIDGTGEETDGYWIVKEVTHLFQKAGEYTVSATVVTDGTGKNRKVATRPEYPSIWGVVNIQEAISRGETSGKGVRPTKLNVLAPAVNQMSQGFNAAPARWSTSRGV